MVQTDRKKLLVISYKFPPQGGVGTRRWAKFVKYLSRRNYEIYVICADYPYHDRVNWADDVKNDHVHTLRLKPVYPAFLLKPEKNILEKLLSKLFESTFKKIFFPLDIAQGFDKKLLPAAVSLIKDKNIRSVIAVGPPSLIHYHAALIKQRCPDIFLIQDYRDPWNTDIAYDFGCSEKGMIKKKLSLEMEKQAVRASDRLVMVSSDITCQMKQIFPEHEKKIFTVHNGYDPDDYPDNKSIKPGSFSLIYTGTIGFGPWGRTKAIEMLCQAVDSLSESDRPTITLYCNVTVEHFRNSDFFSLIRKYCLFQKMVSPKQLPDLIRKHSHCLTINSEMDSNAFGTKVFDYMALKRKILLISGKGELYHCLKNSENFAAEYFIAEIRDQLLKMAAEWKKGIYETEGNPAFCLENLTSSYEGIIDDQN